MKSITQAEHTKNELAVAKLEQMGFKFHIGQWIPSTHPPTGEDHVAVGNDGGDMFVYKPIEAAPKCGDEVFIQGEGLEFIPVRFIGKGPSGGESLVYVEKKRDVGRVRPEETFWTRSPVERTVLRLVQTNGGRIVAIDPENATPAMALDLKVISAFVSPDGTIAVTWRKE